MTAKEKAEELVNRMMLGSKNRLYLRLAKQCALIAAEEVLGYMGADRGTEFWVEVKNEIKKL
jgi:hypothetical protein